MTLSDILRRLDAFDDDATIVAAMPWTPDSPAQVIDDADARMISCQYRDGLSYFLEIAIARELRADWPAERGEDGFCRRLIAYATHDA